jgi:hypothetical protein
MSKKTKTSKTKRLTTKTTTAPMIVRASAPETPVATPIVAQPPVAPAVAQPPVAPAVATETTLDREVIARMAFSKFLARGCTHGHALEDWLSAEAELRASFDARNAKA